MPFFGMMFLAAGLALLVYTVSHSPNNPWPGVAWVYKPEFYYLFLLAAAGFSLYGIYEIIVEIRSKMRNNRPSAENVDHQTQACPSCQEQNDPEAALCRACGATLSAAGPGPAAASPQGLTELSPRAGFCPYCGRAAPRPEQDTCPHCGSGVPPEAQFCEICGQGLVSPKPAAPSRAVKPRLAGRGANLGRSLSSKAMVGAGLMGALVFGVGIYVGQTLRPPALPMAGAGPQTEAALPEVGRRSSEAPEQGPGGPKPLAPPSREALEVFQVGTAWTINWHSKYRYRGLLQIQEEVGPNQYLVRITISYRTKRHLRRTVSMDGLLTVHGDAVVINCRNPSVSWWDTDDFYLKRHHHTMSGYNVDTKGRRGRAVFTRLAGV